MCLLESNNYQYYAYLNNHDSQKKSSLILTDLWITIQQSSKQVASRKGLSNKHLLGYFFFLFLRKTPTRRRLKALIKNRLLKQYKSSSDSLNYCDYQLVDMDYDINMDINNWDKQRSQKVQAAVSQKKLFLFTISLNILKIK